MLIIFYLNYFSRCKLNLQELTKVPTTRFFNELAVFRHQYFPIYWIQSRFDVSCYTPHLFGLLDIELPSEVEGAVPKRQAEFLAGRYIAKLGMLMLSLEQKSILKSTQVLIGEHRSPIWPPSCLGSITHSANVAQCLVSVRKEINVLGLDGEDIMPESFAREVALQVCTPEEVACLPTLTFNYKVKITLLFSAKEAIFKALYPKVKRYFDFDVAKLVAINCLRKELTFELSPDFVDEFGLKQHYQVCYSLTPSFVVTMLID